MVRAIHISVSDDFVDTGWTTDPDVATIVLDVAQRIVHMIRTSPSPVTDTVERAIDRALDSERARRIASLEQEVVRHDEQNRRLATELSDTIRRHEVEVCRSSFETDAALQAVKHERDELRRVHDQLTQTMSEQLERVRIEERRQADDASQSRIAALSDESRRMLSENMELQRQMAQKVLEMSELQERHAHDMMTSRARIVELETPMGRGRAGEMDVAETLRGIGLQVTDTSMGEYKERGYLDLLVFSEGDPATRVAIEMKNVQVVQKQDRDDFERKVRSGIANKLFETAVFISIRAHTKMGNPVVLQMFPDDGGRPLVPVTWLGTERAKHVTPLTQEQVETHVLLVLALTRQCDEIRRELCSGVRDEHVAALQQVVDVMNLEITETFSDLARQNRLVEELRTNLHNVRARCIAMYTSLWSVNRTTPWLGRTMEAPWLDVYNTALAKANRDVKEADIWNQCSKSKGIVERTIGKEAMFIALRKRRKRDQAPETTTIDDDDGAAESVERS